VLKLLTVVMVLGVASSAYAQEPKMPSKLSGFFVKKMYLHYSKEGYSLDQMKDYLRHKHLLSEARIARAQRCIVG